MDVGILRWFFFWCTFLNALILGGVFLVFAFAGDKLFYFHRKWFALDRASFDTIIYLFMGVYKLLILVFAFVPWLALLIAG